MSMDLKRFSQESRTRLMSGVARRLQFWGFDAKGQVVEEVSKVDGGYMFRGTVHDDPGVPRLWDALRTAIGRKGLEVVVEEAAYTWFNRMMAMQILSKQGFEEPQLDYAADGALVPQILKRAQQGYAPFLDADEKQRLDRLIGSFTQDQEALALLLSGFCHHHRTLSRVFGKPDDYTELLLPDDMLKETGFLYLLNTTDALNDKEYQKVELIGWLYQFYISERKDEVFAAFGKGKKAEAKDIPAATQIFTPNWIVKYMVENTAGKAWLDKFPASPLKGEMKYLVENDSDGTREPIIDDVEGLTLIDPACGSGHILVEGFELLYKMYLERYYSPEEAVDSILKHNLFGLDIDDRAAQLATFAVLLKAAQFDRDVWSRDVLPQVYAMPESKLFAADEIKTFLGPNGTQYGNELEIALGTMRDAKNLGSVMKLQLSPDAQYFVAERFEALKASQTRDFLEETVLTDITPYIPVLLTMTRKFTSVVANPPYMGQKNMNADLKAYVNKHYPISKSDLFAVFMESSLAQATLPGYVGMINQHSWMFLSSYEKLRLHLLENHSIVSMLHLGPRTFEELSGEVVQSTAFVLANGGGREYGTYHRLVDDRNVHEKEAAYLARKSVYRNIPQSNFSKIPGSPIAYWVRNRIIDLFEGKKIEDFVELKEGLTTGDNKLFLRHWWEVSRTDMAYMGVNSKVERKWFPYAKGGAYRKWYGNRNVCVNWSDQGAKVKSFPRSNLRNERFYLMPGFTYSSISSRGMSMRYMPEGGLFDTKGPTLFSGEVNGEYVMSFLNSSVAHLFLEFYGATVDFKIGNLNRLPLLFARENEVVSLTKECVKNARLDYDKSELSWNFKRFPVGGFSTLMESFDALVKSGENHFFELQFKEEELNRLFIEIYGLQDELTPKVLLKDITILQEELDRDDLEKLEGKFRAGGGQPIDLPIKRDAVMQQLVSYCVGLMMGRYRLDKPGLNIAHPDPTAEELAGYDYNGHRVEIDDDAILPLMGSGCQFPDDVLQRTHGILDAIWGEDTRTANLNFMQDCMGKDLEKYLVKDFFKDHFKRYKKKPIYWLFASKKGAFQVLVYMHRMNAFTVEKIRSNYLLEHLKHMRQEEQQLTSHATSLSARDTKRLDQLRKDIAECEAYDLELKDVADRQIAFDLDDGVTENHKLFGNVVAPIK